VKENGYDAWRQKMIENYSCENCGTINSIYTFECRNCGNHPSNPYVERNLEEIVEAVKNKK
jgi:ribosomal protein L40E